jgi:hypothetical protein
VSSFMVLLVVLEDFSWQENRNAIIPRKRIMG